MRTSELGTTRHVAFLALAASAIFGLPGCGFTTKQVSTGTGGTTGIDGGSGGSGTGTGGSSQPTPTSLTITPASATLTVTNAAPTQTQQYTVTAQVNGQTVDYTSKVTYATSPSGVVTIDSNGLATTTGTSGGNVKVTASLGGLTTSAALTERQLRVWAWSRRERHR